MNKKLIRKLFFGILSLMLTAVSFTTTTYAWFKINSSASISGFEFEATGGQGFLVSADGENWGNFLDSQQMKSLIIKGYDKEGYKFKDGKLVYSSSELELSDEAKNRILSKISLLPLTSNDGIELKDLYDSSANIESGRYIEFDVYFRHASNNSNDDSSYSIYLLGEDRVLDDGTQVTKTSISSITTTVDLKTNMITRIGDFGPDYTGFTSVSVNSSNALRFSIQDTTLETPMATIYELSDDRERDLGSYATDYGKDTYLIERPKNYSDLTSTEQADIDSKISAYNSLQDEEKELFKCYGCDVNAMYTYYNKLRPSSSLDTRVLKYDEKPKTYRTIDDTVPSITTVKAGEGAKKVTFRFWLEGWDADCFDGLANSIRVKLSFTGKRKIV